MKRLIRAISFAGVIICSGCFPYRGAGQLPIAITELRFVDVETGEAIPRVAVLPTYQSFRGVSTGAGHGPDKGTYRCFVAHSFLYEQGTPFKPRELKAIGIGWGLGWAFTGSRSTLEGVTLLARGYEPVYFDYLWSNRRTPITFTRAAGNATHQLLQELRGAAPAQAVASTKWGRCGETPAQLRLTKEEVEVIAEFLSGT